MFQDLIWLDTKLFIAINDFGGQFLDNIMTIFSDKYVWIPLYAAIAYAFFHKQGYKTALLAIGMVFLTFALTDQISASVIKPLVARLRPTYEPCLHNVISMLEHRGGRFGFVSAHACNTFGLATFTTLYFRKRLYSFGIFLWASMVSISRIYVGKHYPGDVICGAMLGVGIALLIFALYRAIERYCQRRFSINVQEEKIA